MTKDPKTHNGNKALEINNCAVNHFFTHLGDNQDIQQRGSDYRAQPSAPPNEKA